MMAGDQLGEDEFDALQEQENRDVDRAIRESEQERDVIQVRFVVLFDVMVCVCSKVLCYNINTVFLLDWFRKFLILLRMAIILYSTATQAQPCRGAAHRVRWISEHRRIPALCAFVRLLWSNGRCRHCYCGYGGTADESAKDRIKYWQHRWHSQ